MSEGYLARLREYILVAHEATTDVLVRVRMTSGTYNHVRRDGAREPLFDLALDTERIRAGLMATLLGVEIWISPNVEHDYIAPVWRSDGTDDMWSSWIPTRQVPLKGDEPLDASPPINRTRTPRWDRLNAQTDDDL